MIRSGRLIAFILPLVVSSRGLGAEPVVACARAAEQGQDLRTEGRFVKARQRFIECSHPSCPNLVRADCVRWLGELSPSIPTVVLVATTDGRDLEDVSVSLDGEPFVSTLDGRAEPVDPGPHVFT